MFQIICLLNLLNWALANEIYLDVSHNIYLKFLTTPKISRNPFDIKNGWARPLDLQGAQEEEGHEVLPLPLLILLLLRHRRPAAHRRYRRRRHDDDATRS